MTTEGQDFSVARGSDVSVEVVIPGVDGSGWTYEASFKHKASQVALDTITTASINATPVDGDTVVTFMLPDTATDNAASGQYSWSLWRTDEGSEQSIAEGTMTVRVTARA